MDKVTDLIITLGLSSRHWRSGNGLKKSMRFRLNSRAESQIHARRIRLVELVSTTWTNTDWRVYDWA